MTLTIHTVSSYEEYIAHSSKMETAHKERWLMELDLATSQEEFRLAGYCHVCAEATRFSVAYRFSHDEAGGVVLPNWREELICERCLLKNRLRATLHLLDEHCGASGASRVYVPEHSGPFFDSLLAKYPNVVGSEYLGKAVGFGTVDSRGIRNEDLTRLTFDDDLFDYIVPLEVFEHIADYQVALGECFRCLAPGGVLLFTVPFTNDAETLVRSKPTSDGRIVHLQEPEYHPDPHSAEGILCYYHFGWDLLDDLRRVGFEESAALLYWSRYYGYLGVEQLQLVAKKPG